ncbi:LysR substrate-binding domain-containing protein [Bradyrhizobium sp. CB1650]|uniref:LysR family transcriptional regulator n=1 Tax=Bradyrhizobium sp. CB1650 TaxID=3039153 RepID=UPI002434A4D8|nr:LysR family transcriptional regulator [Bradyrhizobium sp. CB1650]WGD50173.1 LysR substrate-binding domain-containing protein [Bradyrhizobium sp. CB1650]
MKKPAPRLASIDLNLLTVFDAVMRERSTTRAGKRLGLSQPAVSHALGRLRHMLKDELFVRGPLGMMPTPRAEQLAMPVRAAMDGLQEALEPDEFEPGKATQSFKIAVDNYAAIVLVAPIAAKIAELAPGVRLDFRPSGTLNILDLLDRSELHLAVGPSDVVAERFTRRRLIQDEFVLVMRRNHLLSKGTEISKEALAGAAQLEISSAQFESETTGVVGSARPSRRARIRAPILSAARILTTSDFVAVLPMKVALEMTRSRELIHRRLTRAPNPIETSMVWLRRLDNQPAHAWLRNEIVKVVDGLYQGRTR